MNESNYPPSLGEAIFTQPLWLQGWVMLLMAANLAAILFIVGRDNGKWLFRKESLAIVVSFMAAGMIMEWMYAKLGYVRLLGLAHLIAWTPVYAYILSRRKQLGMSGWYGKYIYFYLIIAGISLLVDALDVVRYLMGDGELFLRGS